MSAIGIDFGTTNSVAAYHSTSGIEVIPIGEPPADWAALGFDRVMPSVVALDDERRMLIGWEARGTQTDQRFDAIKRLFKEEEIVTAGGEDFFVEEVAAAIFHQIRSRIISNGIDFSQAVITVPANSRGLARYRTKVCAGLAGIEPLALINEPTAAAMAYSQRQLADDQMILVFDFGGGTLDVTLLEARDGMFFEQASAGVPRLGGIDLDNAVMRHIVEEVAGSDEWTSHDRARIKLEVERAKIRLSDSEFDETVITDAALPGFRLTRPKFNDLTRTLIERSGAAIQRVFSDMRMVRGDVDTLLLVGGSSKVPAVRQFVAEHVGLEPATGIDPMTAVAEGAAVACAILQDEIEDTDFFVSTEHALGTVVLNPRTATLSFSPVIQRNQKLPAKQTETFYPIVDFQDEVRITVIEGDADLPIDHPDNQILTEFDVPFDPPRPMDEAGFELTYTYDTDGLLHVDIVDLGTSAPMTDRITVSFKGARDPGDLVGIAGRVRSSVDGAAPIAAVQHNDSATQLDPESEALIKQAASKVIPFVDDDDAGRLKALVEELRQADGDTIEAARSALSAALREFSYLL